MLIVDMPKKYLTDASGFVSCAMCQKYLPLLYRDCRKDFKGCLIKGELPDEHGDLIDANVLIDRVNKEKAPIWWKELITEWIDKQPTVIAAERLTEDDDGYLPQSDWWDF